MFLTGFIDNFIYCVFVSVLLGTGLLIYGDLLHYMVWRLAYELLLSFGDGLVKKRMFDVVTYYW